MLAKFNSRRSVVYSSKGICASTQPLATASGLKILAQGGNCVDACVAISASLCVLEPSSTGIGGDCFALFHNASKNEIYGLNGTGRSAKNLSLKDIRDSGIKGSRIPTDSIFSVNVPGAIAGWVDAVEKWGSGKVSLEQILSPAIELAEKGAPVSEISSFMWKRAESLLIKQNGKAGSYPILSKDGKAPNPGDFVKNQLLADTLKSVAKHGKKGFYEGDIADSIVTEIQKRGGKITKADLSGHTSTFVDPIFVEFEGKKIWEIPPNGQGLVALLALGIIRELDNLGKINLKELKHNSPEYLHVITEALKIAFYDSDEYVSDPAFKDIPLKNLLSTDYLRSRAEYFDTSKLIDSNLKHGVPNPMFKSDTVYFTVSDQEGNACSFINSVYENFGSGIIVPGRGFSLHNRGANFNLTEGSSNCIEGGKRPYHTIIPSMITDSQTNELYASFGNMGGYMQATGHVQHVLNMLIFGLNPQESIDSPRICLTSNPEQVDLDRGRGADGPVSTPITIVALEEGMPQETIDGLKKLGHSTKVVEGNARAFFGRAQIIRNESKDGQLVHSAGSDQRGDGAAVPFL